MTASSNLPHEVRSAGEHLAVVQSLCLEVQGAIQALTANRLAEFKAYLERQEDLCARLEAAMKLMPDTGDIQPPSRPPLTNYEDMGERILAAHQQLAELNRRYAALLRRSNRSAGLLAANCRTFIDGYGATAQCRSSRHEWFAET